MNSCSHHVTPTAHTFLMFAAGLPSSHSLMLFHAYEANAAKDGDPTCAKSQWGLPFLTGRE